MLSIENVSVIIVKFKNFIIYDKFRGFLQINGRKLFNNIYSNFW